MIQLLLIIILFPFSISHAHEDACFANYKYWNYCCNVLQYGPQGNPECWNEISNITYKACCRDIVKYQALSNSSIQLAPELTFEDYNCEGHAAWRHYSIDIINAINFDPSSRRVILSHVAAKYVDSLLPINDFPILATCPYGQLSLVLVSLCVCINQYRNTFGMQQVIGDFIEPCNYWFDFASSLLTELGDMKVLFATKWPILELLYQVQFDFTKAKEPVIYNLGHDLKSKLDMDEHLCQNDSVINWRALQAESLLLDDVFFGVSDEALRMLFHPLIDHELPSRLANEHCPMGVLFVSAVKFWLCARSEPSCFDVYADYISQTLKTSNLVHLLFRSSKWKVLQWISAFSQTSRRHLYDLGLTQFERTSLGIDSTTLIGCMKFKNGVKSNRRLHTSATCQRFCSKKFIHFGISKDGDCSCLQDVSDMTPIELCIPIYDDSLYVFRVIFEPNVIITSSPSGLIRSALDIVNKRRDVIFLTMVWGLLSKYISSFAKLIGSFNDSSLIVTMLCLDEASYSACKIESNLHCLSHSSSPSALQKYLICLIFLQLGSDIVWVDFDTYWFVNPKPIFDFYKFDILTSIDYDSTDCAMNAIFAIKSTRDTRHWLLSLIRWLYVRPYLHCQVAWQIFLHILPPTGRDIVANVPKWGALNVNTFVNANVFEGLGWNGNFSTLCLFHFFYGWNSGAGRDLTSVFSLDTYKHGYPDDLFKVFYGENKTLIQSALKASIQPLPSRYKSCRKELSASNLQLGMNTKRNIVVTGE